MPHKFNATRRPVFDVARNRVTSWAEYNESLRQRGDLTVFSSVRSLTLCGAHRVARHEATSAAG